MLKTTMNRGNGIWLNNISNRIRKKIKKLEERNAKDSLEEGGRKLFIRLYTGVLMDHKGIVGFRCISSCM